MQNYFNSVNGKSWALRSTKEYIVDKLVQDLDISDFLARIVSHRTENPTDLLKVERWLEPRLKFDLPSPFLINDMDKAIERIIDAIKLRQKVTILGDYDVDGATSSALLYKVFKLFDLKVSIYIPDRLKEGYGPNNSALNKIKEKGADLLITVDCGITAFKEVEYANDINLDTIIIDHHAPEAKLPKALAIVNPNRLDDNSGLGMLAAVGVSFMLACALKSQLIKDKIFEENKKHNLMQFLDLVALGTICDVVPLTGPNRSFVKQGLKFMSLMNNIGIKMLFEQKEITDFPNTYHVGYILGPKINAGGRVGKSDLGVKLLISEDIEEARGISIELNEFNEERKKIEHEVFYQAKNLALSEKELDILVLSGTNWHSGVIGIVASRIVEHFNKPTFIISLNDDESKGSARSIPGINIGNLITSAKQKGLLINGGGHPMAGGITVDKNKIDDLKLFLNQHTKKQIDSSKNSIKWIDLSIAVSGINLDLYKQIGKAEPFGPGNPEPRFIIQNAVVYASKIVGEHHINCFLSDSSEKKINAVAFRSVGTKLGDALLNKKSFHVIGRLKHSVWNGNERMQILIEDLVEIY